MSFALRPYQSDAVEAGVAFLRGELNGHGLIVAPTGSGKSLLLASIATRLDRPCLIFQPTKEILEQNQAKLRAYGYEPAVYSASVGTRDVGAITLATIGSVTTHPEMFAGRYVLVDECHLVNAKGGMYERFFAALGPTKILGFSATPYRLSTDGYGGSMLKFLTRTRPRLFTHVVHLTQIGALMAQGYLVTPTYQPVPGFSREALAMNTTGAEYTEASVRRHFNATGFADRLVRVVQRLLAVGRRNVLVFTTFVEESRALAAAIPGAQVVTGETSALERASIVDGFRAGRTRVVSNVGVLALGFDYPELDTVVLARPTASLPLFYQQVGRVLRPHPQKADAWVVDMVDQVGLFGKVEDLVLRPGGKRGQSWEVVSGERVLTNVYYGNPPGMGV